MVVSCWKCCAFKLVIFLVFFSLFPISILCARSEKVWWKRRVWLNRWSQKTLRANVLFPHFSLGKRNFRNQFNNDENKSTNHTKDIQKKMGNLIQQFHYFHFHFCCSDHLLLLFDVFIFCSDLLSFCRRNFHRTVGCLIA